MWPTKGREDTLVHIGSMIIGRYSITLGQVETCLPLTPDGGFISDARGHQEDTRSTNNTEDGDTRSV